MDVMRALCNKQADVQPNEMVDAERERTCHHWDFGWCDTPPSLCLLTLLPPWQSVLSQAQFLFQTCLGIAVSSCLAGLPAHACTQRGLFASHS